MKYFKYILYPIALLHYLAFKYSSKSTRHLIQSDIDEMNRRNATCFGLLHYLVTQKPYRNLFYYRIGGGQILKVYFEALFFFLYKFKFDEYRRKSICTEPSLWHDYKREEHWEQLHGLPVNNNWEWYAWSK